MKKQQQINIELIRKEFQTLFNEALTDIIGKLDKRGIEISDDDHNDEGTNHIQVTLSVINDDHDEVTSFYYDIYRKHQLLGKDKDIDYDSVPKTRFKVENQSTNMYSNLHPGIRDLEPPIIQAPTQKKTIKKFLIKLDDRLSQEEVEKVNKGIAEHMFIAYNSNTIQEITTLEFEEE